MKIFAIAVLLLIAVWWADYSGSIDIVGASKHGPRQQISALAKAGDECLAIAEKAMAHFIPKLEFQRLELAGRKANVVVRCMADHHFYQNPAWLKYAQPIAAKASLEQHVSVNEAIENLKRVDMLIFEPAANKPVYWQQVKTGSQ